MQSQPLPASVTPGNSAEVGQEPTSNRVEFIKTMGRLGKLTLLLGALWGLYYALHMGFPYIRNATDLIYEAKLEHAIRHPLFRDGVPCRVLILGHSQILSGFQPDRFDALAGTQVASYNMGLPDERRFVDNLEKLLASGQRPTHVFITCSWQPDRHSTRGIFNFIESDTEFLQAVFPFRRMPRDFVLFLLRARGHGGVAANYKYARKSVDDVVRDRGYYFIEGQSHYPGDRIPEDFRAAADNPNFVATREVRPEGQEFKRLMAMADKYDFQLYFVPVYGRPGQFAVPPVQNDETARAIKPYPRLHLLGPDYWIYPRRNFSDQLHVNRDGAAKFTEDLYQLTRGVLPPSAASGTTVP
ncbi:MAG TPA: hypothetical protein VMF06_15620 [Candidatus Limnocylindria bacterium]|jgi:hypothetical protein|nr:hypothetical protein [Candidatus Limnocylindria bacterium]